MRENEEKRGKGENIGGDSMFLSTYTHTHTRLVGTVPAGQMRNRGTDDVR